MNGRIRRGRRFTAAGADWVEMENYVHIVVDGQSLEVLKDSNLLQAMLDAGLDIPHYCYHPKLSIDGSCRLCSVKIEKTPKMQIACNTPVRDGMIVHTDDSEVAETRRGVLELLLLNHPLDCPICDKSGECWLQNYSMRFGSRVARTVDPRRKHGKRLDIGERMLLDQERCILCRRCVRFCREVSKTGELVIFNRGDRSILDIADRRLDNAYSMCTSDICPVGALEMKDFHHRLRVWFLTETASVCPGCSNGCNIMIDEYQNRIWRLMPRRNDHVNDTWMCDAGRFTYKPLQSPERSVTPRVRHGDTLTEVRWSEAVAAAADGLLRIIDKYGSGAVGAVMSPHLTLEDNYQFGCLLRAMGTSQTAMSVHRGPSDDFLIKEEKAPNARGVRALGLVRGRDDGLGEFLQLLEAHKVKGLYLCGDDLVKSVDRARLEKIIDGLEFLVVQALTPSPPLNRAAVFMPSTAFSEKTGTFMNQTGRLQRIMRAIEPPPGWLSDADIFVAIKNRLRNEHERYDIQTTWHEITRSCPAFSSIAFDQIGPLGVQPTLPSTSSLSCVAG